MDQTSADSKSSDVLILGASARAAAMSAARAGLRVWALDLFGDLDLIETAHQSRRITRYRNCLQILPHWPLMPCLVTGALENHPRLIERLSRDRTVWGTSAEEIRKVRSPRRLWETLHRAGLPALKIWTGSTPPVADGRWMLKPRRSAGGLGIFVWDEHSACSHDASVTLRKPHLFQQRAEGEAASAVFLSEWDQITFVGAARLLCANVPGHRFGYGGAIGPIELSHEVTRQLLRAGQTLAAAFELKGLWGLDFLHDDSNVWVTEVNPRYTATVELYEHAFATALIAHHQRACEDWKSEVGKNRHVASVPFTEKPATPVCVGKVVVYSPCEFVVPPWKDWTIAHDGWLSELKILADWPAEGHLVQKGFPVCSLFAAGRSERECRLALIDRTESLAQHFQDSGVSFELGNAQEGSL